MLPPDVAGFGFDNNADALTLSPALTERYLGAAAKISQMALARPRGMPTAGDVLRADRSRPGQCASATICRSDPAAGSRCSYYFPADGEYLFEMRPKESGAGGGFEGITAEPHQLDIAIDNVKVWTGTLGGPEFGRGRGGEPAGAAGDYRARIGTRRSSTLMKFRVPVKAGSASGSGVLRREDDGVSSKTSSTRRCVASRIAPAAASPRFRVVTITGPLPETATIGDTASRRRVLICSPAALRASAQPTRRRARRRIISTLARRAYRRPVTDVGSCRCR